MYEFLHLLLYPCSTREKMEFQVKKYYHSLGRQTEVLYNSQIGHQIFYFTVFLLSDYFNSCSGGAGGSMSLVVGLPNNSYKPITNTAWVRTRLLWITKKGTLNSQVINFTSCLPMVGGSLRALLLLPPLKLVTMI